jgi:hypothetical protein
VIEVEPLDNYNGAPPSWSADGSWLFWAGKGGVFALAQGESTPLHIDTGDVELLNLAAF